MMSNSQWRWHKTLNNWGVTKFVSYFIQNCMVIYDISPESLLAISSPTKVLRLEPTDIYNVMKQTMNNNRQQKRLETDKKRCLETRMWRETTGSGALCKLATAQRKMRLNVALCDTKKLLHAKVTFLPLIIVWTIPSSAHEINSVSAPQTGRKSSSPPSSSSSILQAANHSISLGRINTVFNHLVSTLTLCT